MQARILPAARGWWWIAEGWRLFKLNPRLLISPLAWYIVAMLLVSLIPLLGEFLALILTFLLRVVTYRSCRAIDMQPSAPAMWRVDKTDLPPLLRLAGIAVVFVLATALVGYGALALLGWLPDKNVITELSTQELLRMQMVLLVLGLPLTMALWFSPVLVGIVGMKPFKAMFFSLVACWRNRWCFAVFALCIFATFFAVAAISKAVGTLLGAFALLFIAPVVFVVMAVMLGAAYASTKDVFGDLPVAMSGNVAP